MTSTRLFYKTNYWLGISLSITPILFMFIGILSEFNSSDFADSFWMIKLGKFNGWTNSSGWWDVILFFVFYFLFFIFCFLFFLFSYTSIGRDFSYRSVLLRTKAFLISCIVLYCTVILIGVSPNESYSESSLEFWCWGSCLLIYFMSLIKYQKYILNRFDEYILIFLFLCLIPISLLIFFKEMTLIDYQLLFFVNNSEIVSPWIYISLIFSPISYLAMPLFFSFNHYMTVKKLIMENSKEELPKDFFKFKFSYE